MRFSLLAPLSMAALLLAAACTDDQKTETVAAAPSEMGAVGADGTTINMVPTTASPIPTTFSARDTAIFRADAHHLANRVATDLKISDPATGRRLEKVYLVRRRRQAQLAARYAADTTGRAAALRQLNDDTDREVRQVLPSPALARTYENGRAGYYEEPTTTEAAEAAVDDEAADATGAAPVLAAAKPAAAGARARAPRRGPRIVKYKKSGREVKIKYNNGMTLKIDEDGHRKVKYSLGAKAKAAAEGLRRKTRK